MQHLYDRDRLFAHKTQIDDSEIAAQALQKESERYVDPRQQRLLDERAQAFKNKQGQMQEEIKKQE